MNKFTYQVKKIKVQNVCKLHRSLKAFKSDECKRVTVVCIEEEYAGILNVYSIE